MSFLFVTLSNQLLRNINLPKYPQGYIYLYLMFTRLRMSTLALSNAKKLYMSAKQIK